MPLPPYTPNAGNASEPTDGRAVGSAAEEFRILKAAVNDLVNSSPINSGAGRAVDTIAVLRTIDQLETIRAFVFGYYTPGDGGGGEYWLDTTDTVSADNSGTIIVATDGGRWKLAGNGALSVHQFGAKGDGSTDDTATIINAITVAAGRTLTFAARTYIANINSAVNYVTLLGARRPRISNAQDRLESGTIIRGSLYLTGNNIDVQNLGVDRGSAWFGSGGDALKISRNTFDGKSVTLIDVVALGRNYADAFHSILVEGYTSGHISDITGAKNQFGAALKVTNTNIEKVTTIDCSTGCILKSDNFSGQLNHVNLDEVLNLGVVGHAAYGLRILADNESITNLNISNVIDLNSDTSVAIECGAGQSISNVNITDVSSKNSGIRALVTGGAGALYAIRISNLTASDCRGQLAELQIGASLILRNWFGSLSPSSAAVNNAVVIGGSVGFTDINGLVIVQNYDMGSRRGLTINNANTLNKLRNVFANLFGNIPQPGFSSEVIAGATATVVSLNYDQNGSSFVKLSCATPATITDILAEISSGTALPQGYKFHLMNISASDISIANNAKIRNVITGGTKILSTNKVASYLWGGTSWHELAQT